jgi:hypothetical protein
MDKKEAEKPSLDENRSKNSNSRLDENFEPDERKTLYQLMVLGNGNQAQNNREFVKDPHLISAEYYRKMYERDMCFSSEILRQQEKHH